MESAEEKERELRSGLEAECDRVKESARKACIDAADDIRAQGDLLVSLKGERVMIFLTLTTID